MTFSSQIRYNRIFWQVVHKVGESSINNIKIFQDARASEISVVNIYTEDQRMRNFLENFKQGGKYTARIASREAGFTREEKISDQK